MSQPLRPFPVRRLGALLLHVLVACGVGALVPAALAQKNAPPPPIPLRDMPVADLAGGIIAWLDVPANTRETIQLTIPTEHHKDLTLVLEPISVLHESHELRAYTSLTEYTLVDVGPESTYSGGVRGLADARAAMSILPHGLLGAIFLPDGSTVWVQPLRDYLPGAPDELHVIYAGDDSSCGGFCDVPDAVRANVGNPYTPRGSCSAALCAATVAIDADYRYFQHWGSLGAVVDRITAIFNILNHQYQRDVGIVHELGTFLVRTVQVADPYSSNHAPTLLSQLRSHWNNNHGSIQRDIAHLFTGRQIEGNIIGRAYIGVVCDLSWAYGFSQSDFDNSLPIACAVDLTSHELGHNWDANHCTCPNSTMHPNLTCTNTFQNSSNPNSITEITAHRNSRDCLEPRTVLPLNNSCVNAHHITANGTYSGSNVGATTSGGHTGCGSSGGGARDVWWVFTAPMQATVTVSTCGSDFDTILAVYSGCPGTPDTLVDCNDDALPGACPSNIHASRLTFFAFSHATYYIRVAGYNGATGNIALAISGIPTHTNVSCDTPNIITPGQTQFGSLFGMPSTGSASCGASDANPAAWYRFTAPCAGTLTLDTCGSHEFGQPPSGIDTVISIHSACPATIANELVCNDDAPINTCFTNGPIRDSRAAVTLVGGQTVHIRVSHAGSIGFGNGVFRLYSSFASGQDIPAFHPLPNDVATCLTPYTGPTPQLTSPECMLPVTWSLVAPPMGMTIDSTTGVISWPTPFVGTYTITLSASSSAGAAQRSFTLAVNRIPPIIGSISPTSQTCGSNFTGPTPTLGNPACNNPVTWSLVAAPAGLTINPATGVVSGVATTPGTHTITIRATNSAGFADRSWSHTVTGALPAVANIPNHPHTIPGGYVGPTPALTSPSCMSPVTWSLVLFPTGMTINPATGVVTWNDPVVGNHRVVIRATNALGFGDGGWRIDVTQGTACDPDVNCDGNVDQDDIACLAQAVAGNTSCTSLDPDFNGDGNVDQDDIDALAQVVGGAACP